MAAGVNAMRPDRSERWVLWSEITDEGELPDFGEALKAHVAAYRNFERRRASVSVWRLLARSLWRAGCETLPRVGFEAGGKPYFENADWQFSLAHSGGLCAVSLGRQPNGVDVERVRADYAPALVRRTLSAAEAAVYDGDFARLWCRKESLAKLDGRDIGAHPSEIDTLDTRFALESWTIEASDGARYALCAAFEGEGGRATLLRI